MLFLCRCRALGERGGFGGEEAMLDASPPRPCTGAPLLDDRTGSMNLICRHGRRRRMSVARNHHEGRQACESGLCV
jgi:hypothetical protein